MSDYSNVPEIVEAGREVANTLARSVVAWAAVNDPDELAKRPDVLHAYRYEILGDGSVAAVYAIDPDIQDGVPSVKVKVFPTMELASQWTPRDEYAGWRHTSPVDAPAGDVEFTFGGGQ